MKEKLTRREEEIMRHFWAQGEMFVRELRELIDSTGSKALIEVDGGVNVETGKLLAAAGSDALVAGNAVFKADDPNAVISALRAM